MSALGYGPIASAPIAAAEVSEFNGLAAVLDDLTVASTGTVAVAGTSAPTLDALTSSATGTVAVVGTATVTLADLTVLSTNVPEGVVVTLDDLTVAATGQRSLIEAPSSMSATVVASGLSMSVSYTDATTTTARSGRAVSAAAVASGITATYAVSGLTLDIDYWQEAA